MKRFFNTIVIASALLAGLCACSKESAEESHLIFFSPTAAYTRIGGIGCTIDNFNGVITNSEILPSSYDLTKVKAFFQTNHGGKVYVKGVEQKSGETVNDFTSPVVYEVVSEAGVKKYTVTLTKSETLSTQTGIRLTSSKVVGNIVSEEERWLAEGVRMSSVIFTTPDERELNFNMFEVDLTRDDIGIRVLTPDNSNVWKRQTLTDQITAATNAGYKVLGAINGDYFNMDNGVPHGVVCQDGVYLKDLVEDPSNSSYFGIRKDGRASLGTFAELQTIQDKFDQALGGHVILALNDGPTDGLDDVDLAKRTAIGMNTGDLKTVYMVSVASATAAGVTHAEIANLMLTVGAGFALNLDGGGSSTFIVNNGGTMETLWPAGAMRDVANGLAIIKK